MSSNKNEPESSTLHILENYRTPEYQVEVLQELLDCGIQRDCMDRVEHTLTLVNGELYIDNILVPTSLVKILLDLLYRDVEEE